MDDSRRRRICPVAGPLNLGLNGAAGFGDGWFDESSAMLRTVWLGVSCLICISALFAIKISLGAPVKQQAAISGIRHRRREPRSRASGQSRQAGRGLQRSAEEDCRGHDQDRAGSQARTETGRKSHSESSAATGTKATPQRPRTRYVMLHGARSTIREHLAACASSPVGEHPQPWR